MLDKGINIYAYFYQIFYAGGIFTKLWTIFAI